MLHIAHCPVCNSNAFDKDLICEDHTVSHESFQLVVCQSCKFKFTNPRPEDNVIGDYYKSEDYISHSNTKKGIISKLYHVVRNYTLKKKLALLSRYVSRGTILDYGCGTGMFLNVCQQNGWKAFGMEPDPGARQIAAGMNLKVYPDKKALLESNPRQQFDAISLWHVLEHVTDLDDTLNFFKESLTQSGVLFIAVPNHTSYDAKLYKENWAAYDVPRHLYHFDVATISLLLKRFNFSLVETLPMKFDSFYVSMLSEKYKTGKISYLSASLNGFKSNQKAKKATDYSSVIYVFRKA